MATYHAVNANYDTKNSEDRYDHHYYPLLVLVFYFLPNKKPLNDASLIALDTDFKCLPFPFVWDYDAHGMMEIRQ